MRNPVPEMNSLEELALESSFLHRLTPETKIVATLAFILAVITTNRFNLASLTMYFFYPAVLIPLAGIPVKLMVKRVFVALPFALFGGIANLFFLNETAFTLWGVAISYGALSFLSIIFKTLLTVSAALIFVASTDIYSIGSALLRIKIPKICVLSLFLTYRYLSVLVEEAGKMSLAYAFKTCKTLPLKHFGIFTGRLLLRSMDRAERVYTAMKMRGFNGAFRSKKGDMRKGDYLFLAGLAAGIAACIAKGSFMGF